MGQIRWAMKNPLEGKISEEVWDEVGVKAEGTEPEAAGVEAAAVKGDAGSDLPQVPFSMVLVSMMAGY